MSQRRNSRIEIRIDLGSVAVDGVDIKERVYITDLKKCTVDIKDNKVSITDHMAEDQEFSPVRMKTECRSSLVCQSRVTLLENSMDNIDQRNSTMKKMMSQCMAVDRKVTTHQEVKAIMESTESITESMVTAWDGSSGPCSSVPTSSQLEVLSMPN
jgi:hypothetical protein